MLCIKDSVIFNARIQKKARVERVSYQFGEQKNLEFLCDHWNLYVFSADKKKSDLKMYNFFLIFNLNDKVHSKNWLMTLRVGMNSFYWTSNITWQLHVVIQNMLSKKHKNWLHLSDGVITRKLSSTTLETMDPLQWGKVRSCVCHRYKSFDYWKLLS